MRDFIVECLSKNKDSTLFDVESRITYAELWRKTEQSGEMLKNILPPKAKCAVLCDRGLNAAMGILACWHAGLVAIPMSKNYGEKHCENIIALAAPDLIICDRDVNMPFAGMRLNIATGETANEKTVSRAEEILCDVAAIMCTSGTTGRPKGAMITEHGLAKNVENIAAYFGIEKSDKMMISRPLYHCAVLTGEFLVSLRKGLDIGFFDGAYDPISAAKFIDENKMTVFCGTPALLNHMAICMKRASRNNAIKTIAASGECMTKKAAANIRSAFADASIYNVYGLTEAGPRVSYLPPERFDEYPESVGVPLNETFAKISEADKIIDHVCDENNRIPVIKHLANTDCYKTWKDIVDIIKEKLDWQPPIGQDSWLHTSCKIEKLKNYCQYQLYKNKRTPNIPESMKEISAAVYLGYITREEGMKEIENTGYFAEPECLEYVLEFLDAGRGGMGGIGGEFDFVVKGAKDGGNKSN